MNKKHQENKNDQHQQHDGIWRSSPPLPSSPQWEGVAATTTVAEVRCPPSCLI
jgi:ribosomal protein S12